jgi:peptidoglycan/LPS O-acetylase OafA/YrhL
MTLADPASDAAPESQPAVPSSVQARAATDDTARLDPLTSLRFFAAAMIVMHHGGGSTLGPEWPMQFALAQGVSFFFVLSGFVLAYNYATLPDLAARKSFYVARLARIWPTHIASAILFVLLIGSISYMSLAADWRAAITVAYVTLTHAWVPRLDFVAAYNSVSWSISTEFFFYVVFPLLVMNWRATWRTKLFGTLGLAFAVWILADVLARYSSEPDTIRGMVAYINPLPRLFEFTLGIAVCHLYRDRGRRMAQALSFGRATLVEAAIVAAVIMGLWSSHQISTNVAVAEAITKTGTMVIETSGFGIVLYAAAIFVFAVGAGAISQVLRKRPLVFLGEISFALYMVHTLFLLYRRQAPGLFEGMPGPLVYALYWATGLSLAMLLHIGVERPCQTLIRGWHRGIPLSAMIAPVRAVILFSFVVAAIIAFQPSSRMIGLPQAGTLEANLLEEPVSFDPGYRLTSVEALRTQEGYLKAFRFSWTADAEVKLSKGIAVHLLDSGGKMIGQLDIAMETGFRTANRDERWTNLVPLSGVDMSRVRAIGVAVYDSRGMAPVAPSYAGTTDWERRRLVVEIESPRAGGRLSAFALTDPNWVNGIARNFAGFFVEYAMGSQRLLRPGRRIQFADGSIRTVLRTEHHGPYLNVFLDGPLLDGSRVGHPHDFEVLAVTGR